MSGSSTGAAKGRLAAAERAAADPILTDALHEGGLSSAQLAVVTNAATEAPESTEDLLKLVDQGASHQELSDAAARKKAAARSRETERLRRARVHTNRHLRVHQVDSGGVRGEFFCDELEWARVAPRVEARAKERWKAAGGGSESLEAHRLDAFIDLLSGKDAWRLRGAGDPGAADSPDDSGDPGGDGGSSVLAAPSKAARCQTIVIIDAEALRRGTTEGESLRDRGHRPGLGRGRHRAPRRRRLRYVIHEGFDIKTVTKLTRDVGGDLRGGPHGPRPHLRSPGCGKRLGLRDRPPRRRLRRRRADRTRQPGAPVPRAPRPQDPRRLAPRGQPRAWKWIAPAHPKSANYIARARKLAAAKGNAARRAAADNGTFPDRTEPKSLPNPDDSFSGKGAGRPK